MTIISTDTYIRRCSKHPFRETLEVILSAINGPFDSLCSKPAGDPARLEVFKNAKCMNENQDKINTCRDKSKDAFFYMLDSSYDKQFAILCCNMKKTYDCTYNKTMETCGKETAKFANNYYSVLQELIQICDRKLSLFPLSGLSNFFVILNLDYDPAGSACEGMIVPDNYKTSIDQKSPLYRMLNAAF